MGALERCPRSVGGEVASRCRTSSAAARSGPLNLLVPAIRHWHGPSWVSALSTPAYPNWPMRLGFDCESGCRRPSTGQGRGASLATKQWSYRYQWLVRCLALAPESAAPCSRTGRGGADSSGARPTTGGAMRGLSRHSTLIHSAGATSTRPRRSLSGQPTEGHHLQIHRAAQCKKVAEVGLLG
jgi:hypothetical protein